MDRETLRERLLVVEDDQTVREYLVTLFSSKGYEVKTASNGEEALHLLSTEHFPVVVTDLILPDVRGLEILNYVQQHGMRSAVLIITAYRSIESVIEALRHGAYDYITKPFTSQILLHRVARAMEKVRMEEATRDLSSRIIYATEEERQRISRDLHDQIGQSLAIIKLTLMAIRNRLVNDSKKDILAEIDGLATHIEETMDEVSRISKDLNPSYVAEVGFFETLRLYLETFSKKTGILVNSYLPESLSFEDPHQEIHIYRIVQEALTNIAKHSGATKVDIHLEIVENNIRFSIADNGKGFNKTAGDIVSGLGLIGIRERAHILGGRCSIESTTGRGTTIQVEIPYGLPRTSSST